MCSPLAGGRYPRPWLSSCVPDIITLRPSTPLPNRRLQPGRPRYVSPLPPLHRPTRRTARVRRLVPLPPIGSARITRPMTGPGHRRPERVCHPAHLAVPDQRSCSRCAPSILSVRKNSSQGIELLHLQLLACRPSNKRSRFVHFELIERVLKRALNFLKALRAGKHSRRGGRANLTPNS